MQDPITWRPRLSWGLVRAVPGVGTMVEGDRWPNRSATSPRRPSSPEGGLTSDRIVAVGIKIADAEGLGAVSMRRVASELGVATMSLYSLSEFALDALDGLGLDHQTTLTAYITLTNYVRGTACIQPGAGGGGRSHDRRRHREVGCSNSDWADYSTAFPGCWAQASTARSMRVCDRQPGKIFLDVRPRKRQGG